MGGRGSSSASASGSSPTIASQVAPSATSATNALTEGDSHDSVIAEIVGMNKNDFAKEVVPDVTKFYKRDELASRVGEFETRQELAITALSIAGLDSHGNRTSSDYKTDTAYQMLQDYDTDPGIRYVRNAYSEYNIMTDTKESAVNQMYRMSRATDAGEYWRLKTEHDWKRAERMNKAFEKSKYTYTDVAAFLRYKKKYDQLYDVAINGIDRYL